MSTPDETDDQRRAAGFPPAPSLPGEQRSAINPPTPVNVSFWLWVVGGVLLIASQAYSLAFKQTIIDDVVKQSPDRKLTPEQIASGTTVLLWVLLVGAVVFALLIALFAYKAREGTRSARTVLTVLTVLALLFLVIFRSPISLVAVLVMVVAAVLMFLPSVHTYFPKVGRKLP